MTKRELLPGEREAWERACKERRWVVRTPHGYWGKIGPNGGWSKSPDDASHLARVDAEALAFTGDTIAYRARSVRPDGTPVVP